jgi:hypothetical protein
MDKRPANPMAARFAAVQPDSGAFVNGRATMLKANLLLFKIKTPCRHCEERSDEAIQC